MMSFMIKLNDKIYGIEVFEGMYILVLSIILQNMLGNQSESSFVCKVTTLSLYAYFIYATCYILYKSTYLIFSSKKTKALFFATTIVPVLIFMFYYATYKGQTFRNNVLVFILKLYAYYFIITSIKRMAKTSDKLSAKNNKLIRFLKFQVVKTSIKFYRYGISKKILSKIGLSYLDLRCITLPKDNHFFKIFYGTNVYEAKLPYIDFYYYYLGVIRFEKCTFTKPKSTNELQRFVRNIYQASGFDSIFNLPLGDYSNVSFDGIDLSKTKFDRGCILPANFNLFQTINKKDLFNAELPIACLKNIHLYNLNNVSINLNSYSWYKNVVTDCQLEIIKNKYSSQIGRNIILPD